MSTTSNISTAKNTLHIRKAPTTKTPEPSPLLRLTPIATTRKLPTKAASTIVTSNSISNDHNRGQNALNSPEMHNSTQRNNNILLKSDENAIPMLNGAESMDITSPLQRLMRTDISMDGVIPAENSKTKMNTNQSSPALVASSSSTSTAIAPINPMDGRNVTNHRNVPSPAEIELSTCEFLNNELNKMARFDENELIEIISEQLEFEMCFGSMNDAPALPNANNDNKNCNTHNGMITNAVPHQTSLLHANGHQQQQLDMQQQQQQIQHSSKQFEQQDHSMATFYDCNGLPRDANNVYPSYQHSTSELACNNVNNGNDNNNSAYHNSRANNSIKSKNSIGTSINNSNISNDSIKYAQLMNPTSGGKKSSNGPGIKDKLLSETISPITNTLTTLNNNKCLMNIENSIPPSISADIEEFMELLRNHRKQKEKELQEQRRRQQQQQPVQHAPNFSTSHMITTTTTGSSPMHRIPTNSVALNQTSPMDVCYNDMLSPLADFHDLLNLNVDNNMQITNTPHSQESYGIGAGATVSSTNGELRVPSSSAISTISDAAMGAIPPMHNNLNHAYNNSSISSTGNLLPTSSSLNNAAVAGTNNNTVGHLNAINTDIIHNQVPNQSVYNDVNGHDSPSLLPFDDSVTSDSLSDILNDLFSLDDFQMAINDIDYDTI